MKQIGNAFLTILFTLLWVLFGLFLTLIGLIWVPLAGLTSAITQTLIQVPFLQLAETFTFSEILRDAFFPLPVATDSALTGWIVLIFGITCVGIGLALLGASQSLRYRVSAYFVLWLGMFGLFVDGVLIALARTTEDPSVMGSVFQIFDWASTTLSAPTAAGINPVSIVLLVVPLVLLVLGFVTTQTIQSAPQSPPHALERDSILADVTPSYWRRDANGRERYHYAILKFIPEDESALKDIILTYYLEFTPQYQFVNIGTNLDETNGIIIDRALFADVDDIRAQIRYENDGFWLYDMHGMTRQVSVERKVGNNTVWVTAEKPIELKNSERLNLSDKQFLFHVADIESKTNLPAYHSDILSAE